MTEREKHILGLLKKDPLISQRELALKLGIQRSSVAVHIANLTKKGFIKGKGYIINEQDYAVVIGGANIDITGFTSQPLVKADSNPGAVRMSLGGVGRNIAENLVKLGITTNFISAVGDDIFGKRIINECQQAGIDTSLVETVRATPSSVYLSVLNHQGDMEIAISDMDVINKVDIERLKRHQALISNSAVAVIDANLSIESIRYLADTFKGKLFLDTVSTAKTRKIKEVIDSFKVIKPNRKEAEILLDRKIKSVKDAKNAVKRFIEKGIETVVISLGKEGVVYGNRDTVHSFKMKKVSSVNATGAGDAFMAVLVYGHLMQVDIHETIKMASTASYLTLQNENTLNPELSLENIRKTRLELKI